jgi:hypothetical protein
MKQSLLDLMVRMRASRESTSWNSSQRAISRVDYGDEKEYHSEANGHRHRFGARYGCSFTCVSTSRMQERKTMRVNARVNNYSC